MTTLKIKKQIDEYLPLLTNHQQELVLNMVKSILQVDESEKRISLKQYNQEIEDSLKEIESGNYKTQAEVIRMVTIRHSSRLPLKH